MSPPFPALTEHPGLATTRQLREHGWTEDAIRHLVASRGRRVLPGVVADHRGPLGDDDRLAAAWLWAGPDAVLTGCRALARHGVPLSRTPAVSRFLVPDGARSRVFGDVQTVRTRRPERVRTLRGVPVTSVERALIDSARYAEVTGIEARALTIAALQRRLTTVERVEMELLAARRNGLAGVRAGVQEHRRGAWSLPESRLIELVARDLGLPPMLPNPRLTSPDGRLIGIPDGYFPDEGVAVQMHSRTHHAGLDEDGRDRWARTVEAASVFERHGIVVVGVAPQTLDRDPAGVAATLREVLAAHRGRPTPEVLVEPFEAVVRPGA